MPYYVPIADRFWPKVDKNGRVPLHQPSLGPCWEWTGYRLPFGHGLLGRGGRKDGHVLAHRLSWELHNGPVPPGKCVLHKCDNPPCVNPEHLVIGTRTDNSRHKVERGRSRKGETHQTARLTEQQVREIRQRSANRTLVVSRTTWGDPDSITAIAKDYGISYVTVFDIVHRKTWKHID